MHYELKFTSYESSYKSYERKKRKKNDNSFYYSLTKDFMHAKFMVGLFTLYMDSFFCLACKAEGRHRYCFFSVVVVSGIGGINFCLDFWLSSVSQEL